MEPAFNIILAVVLLALVLTLGAGLYALFRGGDFGRSYSNKLMRLRIVIQAVAICVLAAGFWFFRRGH
jgi:hypothetical protein